MPDRGGLVPGDRTSLQEREVKAILLLTQTCMKKGCCGLLQAQNKWLHVNLRSKSPNQTSTHKKILYPFWGKATTMVHYEIPPERGPLTWHYPLN
ncbi:hypothetical protein TNIN_136091 [Trichonephila inaurata madagascariensis]|uniref:Uncharacterized protein n=1 Tax=Trichonephila inaurata madagascariensis TaxID=2747483 RepID=A0A8X6XJC1_9ARAC|nr:hypothetical protein TNIN_136091 [Trichonephila inaurata madagascariensis]